VIRVRLKMTERLPQLRAKRGHLKGTITRLESFVDDPESVASGSAADLQARRSRLVSTFQNYETVNIEMSIIDESESETSEMTVFEDKYYRILAKLDEAISRLNTKQTVKVEQTQPFGSKIPNIDIPYFDGKDFTKFKPFMDLFNAVFDKNPTLSDVQKLFYLRKYVTDDALGIIVNLPIVNESYKEAMDLLKKRFDNKPRLITNHINLLLDLPSMQKGTAANIRAFVSQIQQQTHALKNLEQPVKDWDMLLISVLTRKLDAFTNRAYHLDREDPENMPTMDEFISFLEKRAMALEDSPQDKSSNFEPRFQYKPNNYTKVSNVAANTYNSPCAFCSKQQHPLYACPKFI
jgi:hypothetical protein